MGIIDATICMYMKAISPKELSGKTVYFIISYIIKK